MVEKLLTSLVESQQQIAGGQKELRQQVSKQAADIEHIKESMIKMVRIEERQINDKEGLNRIDRRVDRHDLALQELSDDIGAMQVAEGKLTTKLTLTVATITIFLNAVGGLLIHALTN